MPKGNAESREAPSAAVFRPPTRPANRIKMEKNTPKRHASALVNELVFVYFPVEGRQADIQQPGCLRFIAARMDQHPLDMKFFHACKVERRDWACHSNSCSPQFRRQVVHRQSGAVGEDYRPLDDILQFPDIALPPMLLQMLHEFLTDALDLFPAFPGKKMEVILCNC